MDKWQSGDVAAFEDLFHQYERMVFKNAYLIMGSRDEAEDVLQDVFTSVWKFRHTFDPEKGKLGTWLHRITVNECLKRRRRRPSMASLDDVELPDSHSSIEERVQDRLDYDQLIEVLSKLDSKHRAVLVLRYFDELSYDEIAQTVGVPLGTVKSRLNHALKALRTRLGDRRRRI
jgi:RNA polymerase sigma-70 factor (ECF subfamily)